MSSGDTISEAWEAEDEVWETEDEIWEAGEGEDVLVEGERSIGFFGGEERKGEYRGGGGGVGGKDRKWKILGGGGRPFLRLENAERWRFAGWRGFFVQRNRRILRGFVAGWLGDRKTGR